MAIEDRNTINLPIQILRQNKTYFLIGICRNNEPYIIKFKPPYSDMDLALSISVKNEAVNHVNHLLFYAIDTIFRQNFDSDRIGIFKRHWNVPAHHILSICDFLRSFIIQNKCLAFIRVSSSQFNEDVWKNNKLYMNRQTFFHDTELTPGQQNTSEGLVSTLPEKIQWSITQGKNGVIHL